MPPLRLDGYVRVSRIGGRSGEGYISADEQREAIERYAAELSGEVVQWHDDQDYSGGNLERPGFQAALERIRADESDGIVVKRIDRFARSVPDGSAIVREIIDENGAVFASCEERIDPRTDDGRYMLNMYLNNAELFLNRIKSGWITTKSRANARGVHIGPTPIGYQRQKSKPLEPHPTYGPAMSKLFKRASAQKYGDSALAAWMTKTAPRESGAPWQPSEIRRWLSNRVYLGEVRYGELVNTDAHPPLTDPATWERCQREPGTQRKAHSKFLLSGLARCAHCRYAMGGQTGGGTDGATPVYRCNGRRCEGSSVIKAEPLEQYVTDLVREHVHGLELEAAAQGADLEALDREYEEAETELQAFVADVNARRLLGEASWQDGLTARALDRDARRKAREEAYAKSRLVSVARDVDDLQGDDLRDLVHGMVRHIFVRRRPRGAKVDDRVLIVWSDDPRHVDVPGPHRSGPFEPIRW
jgi:site-specific DNA recombinase